MLIRIIFQKLFWFALWFLPFTAKTQDTCVFLYTIPQTAGFATSDHLANIYITYGFELEKYDSTGRLVTRYSNNRLGNAGYVDASNPLKILVWYPDFQTAVFLDRNLTELGRLNLAQAGYPAVRCLASAADGNLWAYDEASSYLLKLSTAGEQKLESQPLNLEFTQRFSPTCIRDDGGQGVFLSDPSQGVAIFDPFAQLDKIILLKGLHQFEVESGILYFAEQDGIRAENRRGLSNRKIAFPTHENMEEATFWISKGRLFVQHTHGLAVYQF